MKGPLQRQETVADLTQGCCALTRQLLPDLADFAAIEDRLTRLERFADDQERSTRQIMAAVHAMGETLSAIMARLDAADDNEENMEVETLHESGVWKG